MTLKEVSSSTLADSVENSILNFIGDEELQPGDLLPREEEIADNLNVSRLCVREGIGRLKALGLVEPRKRRGTVLRKPDPFLPISKIASANLFSKEDRLDFMEIRIALELGMSGFIYARKTPADLKKLREISSAMATVNEDIDFHSFLMSVSGNRNAREFRRVLMGFFKKPGSSEMHAGKNSVEDHLRLCDVLEKGSALEFHAELLHHFQPYFENFIRNNRPV